MKSVTCWATTTERASRLNVAQHELVDHPLLDRAGSDGAFTNTDPWLLPLGPEEDVNQSRTSAEWLTSQFLKAVADDETELLDEDPLELLAASQQ